jgi:4-amino-4-deoxy-L-arabinose transferase-like glycosyltransferase
VRHTSNPLTGEAAWLRTGRSPDLGIGGGSASARVTVGLGLVGAVVMVAVAAPFMTRYGWDRDELYFVSAAHHLALGYVDFPPLIAVVGWIIDKLDPRSLLALRLVSLTCGAASVVLVAFIARELGGGRRAQLFAAVAWALTPYILGSASIFHPTWLDLLAWTVFLYLVVRLRVRRKPQLWVLLGVTAGIGLEAKYTIAFLILAFAAALLLTRERGQLATVWPWLGLAIAIALLAPNLVWQVHHGWPSVQFFSGQNAKTAADTPRPAYLAEQLLFLGVTSILAAAGTLWMWRCGVRALALIPLLVTIIFLLERGRSYYPLPADSLAVAAGALALDTWLRSTRRLVGAGAAVAAQAAVIVLAGPIVVPFYSTRQLVGSSLWKLGYFKDEIGWPEMTAQVERAWSMVPLKDRASGAILAANYGEASALQFYGRRLPIILSGHLSWQYWRPQSLRQRFVLTVGYDPRALSLLCRSWRVTAHLDNRWHLNNEERGQPVAACRLKRQLGSDWHLIASDQL